MMRKQIWYRLFDLGFVLALFLLLPSFVIYITHAFAPGPRVAKEFDVGPIHVLLVARDYQRGFYIGTTDRGFFEVDGCKNEVFPDTGFRHASITIQNNHLQTIVAAGWTLPLAIVFGVPLALPWMYCFWLDRRDKLRIGSDLCLSCGYDLHASGSTCPECGATRTIELS